LLVFEGAHQITKKLNLQTVETVVKRGLCTGCGTCVSICPTKAISIAVDTRLGIYLPKIDSSKCSSCTSCYDVCPGLAVNFKLLSRNVSPPQETTKPNSVLLGNYLNCYVGYATDNAVRFDSSSGGIATQLLVFALEEGIIDGALVTRMNKDRPLEPEPFIARTTEEIRDASKSKYCPVPANTVFREILEKEGKYAVVGVPCHIHGLRKAQAVNKKLKERIVFSIGLLCSHNDSFNSTKYMLKRLKVNSRDVSQISYRGAGWPGILKITKKSGETVECPFHDWIKPHEYCFFTPSRCLVCCDGAAELADISTGDAWLPDYSKDHIGTSVFVSRSAIGEKILQQAKAKGKLAMKDINSNNVVRSQGNMRFKKNGFAVREFMFKLLGKSLPTYDATFRKIGFIELPRSGIIFVNQCLASKWFFNQNLEQFISLQVGLKKFYSTSISQDFT
jgi:coenzyme F420 hydrogenase subunit beta